jgi:anti-sigma factor ChrR (cupin superfamily)
MATQTPHAENHGDLTESASRYVEVDYLPWISSKFPGVAVKTLMEDDETGLATMLFRMDPGARLPLHEHTGIEQTFVLEGSLADEEGEVTVGNYVWRPAGSRHTAHSPNGALAISFFVSPNRFLDED